MGNADLRYDEREELKAQLAAERAVREKLVEAIRGYHFGAFRYIKCTVPHIDPCWETKADPCDCGAIALRNALAEAEKLEQTYA